MNITGTVSRSNGRWMITDQVTGKRYELSGQDFPDRLEGCSARVVGVIEDSFGLGVLHHDAVLQVQRWNTV